jgi:hypothetical protein
VTLSFIHSDRSKKYHFRDESQTKDGTEGVGRMNVGSANTREGDMGCPGMDSNQMPIIRSLLNSINNNIRTNQIKGLTETNADGSSGA